MKETTQLKQQNQTFQLSVNRHHRDKTVGNPKHYRDGFKTKELTIKALAEAVKRGHAWSCATYDRSMRSKGNYQQAQLIGLDIDNGLTLNDALNHPFVKKYGQLIYTSASHQKPKGDTPPCDRFRIVFSASQPLNDLETYEQLVKAVMGHFREADEACKDASRYWAGNSQAEIFILDGNSLPASLIEEAKAQAKIEWEAREKRRQETLARVNSQDPDEVKTLALEALNFIPPRQPGSGTYEESLRVLMALTTIFGPTEGIAIAESWSPPMKGWNPARKIQGFRVGEVTAGSLFWIAQQHGFKFPERQWHSDDIAPIEPDHHAYQSHIQWEKEQETLEEIITNERKITRFRNLLGKKLKKLNPRKAKKYAKINPFNQGESYKGSKIKAWLKALKKGFNVLANDFMGSGKTYDVLKIINPEGRVIYLSKNHRNPSIKEIEDKFRDLHPRTQWGFYYNSEGKLVEANQLSNPDILVIQPNCIRGDMFKSLKNKGYSVESTGDEINPICKNCPLLGQCASTPGMYRHERQETLKAKYIRGHVDSMPRDDDYSKDIIIIEEPTEQLNPTKTLETYWTHLLIELDRIRPYLTEEDYQTVDRLLQEIKPLFKNKERWGLEHKEILEAIKGDYQLDDIIDLLEAQEVQFINSLLGKLDRDHLLSIKEFESETEYQQLKQKLKADHLSPADRKAISKQFIQLEKERNKCKDRFKIANSLNNSQKNSDYVKEISQKIEKLPPNALVYVLKAIRGDQEVSLRVTRNPLIITIFEEDKYQFLNGQIICLDTTIDPDHLAKILGQDKPLKALHQELKNPLNNLTITNINTPGLKTNNPTDTAINRVRLVLQELSNKHGDIPLVTHKSIGGMAALGQQPRLDTDGHWFVHNRGSNQFQGNPNLAYMGTPSPHLGAIRDQYRAIYGTLNGFEEYYDRLQKAEILQGIGRQRCQRYPEKRFNLFFIATEFDLDFLRAYGAKVKNIHSIEIHPEAGDATQVARLELLKGIQELTERGVNVTSENQLGKHLEKSRQAVNQLLRHAGVKLVDLVEQIKLSTRSIKATNRGGCQPKADFLFKEFRAFLELDIVAMANEVIEEIHSMGWDDFVKYCLNAYPEPVKARILGILWYFLDFFPRTELSLVLNF